MKKTEGTAGEKSTGKTPPGKKPYQKPEFRYERVFETMALACGKVFTGIPTCRVNRKSS